LHSFRSLARFARPLRSLASLARPLQLDDKLEEIAFHQTELEDLRIKLTEQQGRQKEELSDARSDLAALSLKLEKKVAENEELTRALSSAPAPSEAGSADELAALKEELSLFKEASADMDEELQVLTKELEVARGNEKEMGGVIQKKLKENNAMASSLEKAEAAAAAAKKDLDAASASAASASADAASVASLKSQVSLPAART
jgi:chromosome segregation ATPase